MRALVRSTHVLASAMRKNRNFTVEVSELEFNVPFQHKHGYIRDDTVQVGIYLPCVHVLYRRFMQFAQCRRRVELSVRY